MKKRIRNTLKMTYRFPFLILLIFLTLLISCKQATPVQILEPQQVIFVIAASDASAIEKAKANVVCDGTTDEVEFNDAIAAGNYNIKATSGNFYFTSAISIKSSKISIRGAGINLTYFTIGKGIYKNAIEAIGTDGHHITDVTLSDMTVSTNYPTNARQGIPGSADERQQNGISIQYVDGASLSYIRAYGCSYNGIQVFHCTMVSVDHCTADTNGWHGIQFWGYVQNSSITNCFATNSINGTAVAGIVVEYGGTQNITVTGNVTWGNVYGIFVYGSCNYVTVTGNTDYNSTKASIAVVNTNFTTVSGNTLRPLNEAKFGGIYISQLSNVENIVGNTIFAQSCPGIYAYHAETLPGYTNNSFNIIANDIYVSTRDGILIEGDSSEHETIDAKISENNIRASVPNAYYSGVRIIQYAKNVDISNNFIENFEYPVNIAATGVSGVVIKNNVFTNNTYAPSDSASSYIRDNVGYIAPGEVRTASGSLTAGIPNGLCFAWHNPEAQDILIKKVVIAVTTGDMTIGSQLDVGIADDAIGTNRGTEFFKDLLLNDVAINDSWLTSASGTQTKWVVCQDSASPKDSWIVGQILDANVASLVGSYYIEYVGG